MGNTELINSGLVIQFNKQPIEFNLALPNFSFTIIMDFKNDNDSKHKVKPEVIDETTAKLTFFNYNNSLGHGTTKPRKIANYRSKYIYMSYRIYAPNEDADKTVHYSFYLSEKKL